MLRVKKRTEKKRVARLTKKVRIRKKLEGTPEKPRLCVFRSLRHIYAQIVDDTKGETLVASGTLGGKSTGSNKEAARVVGEDLAKKAIERNIVNVVFDRNGLLYHGRVKSLADGARKAGLKF